MPLLMKLPDNLSMRQALAVREVVAGAEEELDAIPEQQGDASSALQPAQ